MSEQIFNLYTREEIERKLEVVEAGEYTPLLIKMGEVVAGAPYRWSVEHAAEALEEFPMSEEVESKMWAAESEEELEAAWPEEEVLAWWSEYIGREVEEGEPCFPRVGAEVAEAAYRELGARGAVRLGELCVEVWRRVSEA